MSAMTGHGPNIGHGYVKYVAIRPDGTEMEPVIFPATIAPYPETVSGSLRELRSIPHDGQRWLYGAEAARQPGAKTLISQDRLTDESFIPILARAALDQLASLNGAAVGMCVTGLPATWALDKELAQQLGARLRSATLPYLGIRVIPEPLGILYAQLLDTTGAVVGDPALRAGRVGVVDLGHLTVDVAIIDRLSPQRESLETWQLGTSGPLKRIRGQIGAATGLELSMAEADVAVMHEAIAVRGRFEELPDGWDRPLLDTGVTIVGRLREAFGNGAQLDAILLGGGGAAQERLSAPILKAFPNALVVDSPQIAVARGYARLAKKIGATA